MVNHRQKTHCLKKLMHYFVLKRNEWTDKNQIMDPYPHFTTRQIVPRPLPFVPGVILAGLKPDGYSFNFGIGGIWEGGSRRCTNSQSAGSRDISKSRGWTWYGLLENLWRNWQANRIDLSNYKIIFGLLPRGFLFLIDRPQSASNWR